MANSLRCILYVGLRIEITQLSVKDAYLNHIRAAPVALKLAMKYTTVSDELNANE